MIYSETSWFWYALMGPAIWSLVNHIDKYIISRYFEGRNVGSLVIFTGCAGFLVSIPILIFDFSAILISLKSIVFIAINGAVLIAAFIPYFYALENEEASLVTPLYQLIPVFGCLLGLAFLGEQLTGPQIVGSLLIITGSVAVSLDLALGMKLKLRPLLLMSLSSFMIAVNSLIFKIVALKETFWGSVFWEYVGGAIFVLIVFCCVPLYRRQFLIMIGKNKVIIGFTLASEFLNIVAKLFVNFATLLGPLALVWVINGFQPFFVLIYGVILTLVIPGIYREKMDRKTLIQRAVAILLIIAGICFLQVTV